MLDRTSGHFMRSAIGDIEGPLSLERQRAGPKARPIARILRDRYYQLPSLGHPPSPSAVQFLSTIGFAVVSFTYVKSVPDSEYAVIV